MVHRTFRSRVAAASMVFAFTSGSVLLVGGPVAAAPPPPTTIEYTVAATTTTVAGVPTVTAGNAVGTGFSWTVPAEVTSVTISAAGGDGGSVINPLNSGFGEGGTGALVMLTLPVTPGDVLWMSLGGDGLKNGSSTTAQAGAVGGPGGGAGGSATRGTGATSINGGGGGSSTMVALNSATMSSASVVAVAGAGGGGPSSGSNVGGDGGTPVGGNSGGTTPGYGVGGNGDFAGTGGEGGTYIGLANWMNRALPGGDGVGAAGGNAFVMDPQDAYTGGGGGGGYGGGGGGAFVQFAPGGGLGWGGGGGGSYAAPSATAVSYEVRADAVPHGLITLSFGVEPAADGGSGAVALPATGADGAPGLAAGTLLVALGAILFISRRRAATRTE